MRILACLTSVALVVACSGNPQPGDSGYPYNVTGDYQMSVVVEGMTYTGTAALSTMKGGDVSGSLLFESPEVITGTVVGTVAGDSLSFTSAYERSGCLGVLTGHGTITEGGATAAGTVEVDDECAPDTLAGDFVMAVQ